MGRLLQDVLVVAAALVAAVWLVRRKLRRRSACAACELLGTADGGRHPGRRSGGEG